MNTTSQVLKVILAILLLVGSIEVSYGQDPNWAETPPDPATAQGENMAVPEGWKWRPDHPHDNFAVVADAGELAEGQVHFINMTPGWHITTGPAVILYHPALTATGNYRAHAKYHLFPPGERNEAFGLFVGGDNLDNEDQSYLYFLIRKTGEYLVKQRHGESTTVIEDWTSHPAIVPHASETTGTATNTLSIAVHDDALDFFVNDEKVTSVQKGVLPVDGTVGLRVNHALNVHVSEVGVEQID